MMNYIRKKVYHVLKKNYRKIIYMLVFLLIGVYFSPSVFAKSTCMYVYAGDSLAGIKSGTLNCDFDYTSGIFGGFSYSCKYKTGEEEYPMLIANKSSAVKNTTFVTDSFYEKNKKCPAYVSVNVQTLSGYGLYFADSNEEMDKIINNIHIEVGKDQFVRIKENSLGADDRKCKDYKNVLDGYVEHLKKQKNEMEKKKCHQFKLTAKERETVASPENIKLGRECRQILDAAAAFSRNSIKELNKYTANKCLDKNSSEYKLYNNTYNSYTQTFEKVIDHINKQSNSGTDFCKRYDCMPASSVDPSTSAALKRSTCEIINVNTDLGRFLNKMVNYIRIGVIFLVLVLGMVDLMGAVGASEEGAFKKAGTRFFKRLIAAALVFLVPAIVNILISLINDASCAGDPNYDPTGGIFDNHA